ncbi:MAG: AraC family transcriptional regulator [bacterium]|nr:AraC family transcriptional regulator [bacterium]
MDFSTLQKTLYDLSDEELFYQKYYYAKQQEYSYQKFLATVDMEYVRQHNLILTEYPETVPPVYEDYWIFDVDQPISALKHNCYTPAIVHSHTFFELTYVYDGTCEQNINNQSVSMRTGDFLIIPPGVHHSISVFNQSIIIQIPVKKATLEGIFFNFLRRDNILSMFFINSIYAQHINDYIIFHSGDDFHIRTAVTHLLLENINREAYWIDMMINTTMNIFGLLLRNYEKSVELPSFVSKSDVQRFGLIRFIQEHFADVSLDMVAEKFHYTPEYTSRLIKQTTGMNFKEIVQKVRIEKAEFLLMDTNLTVMSIALQIGYENVEHFIRTFKKIDHMTPTAYRKLHGGRKNPSLPIRHDEA